MAIAQKRLIDTLNPPVRINAVTALDIDQLIAKLLGDLSRPASTNRETAAFAVDDTNRRYDRSCAAGKGLDEPA